ncbi:hypothetical protein LCGC14_1566990 [marine sediment metagenome]|uniref:Recombination endonuclease VII n=1 Tax=marine sediment metagenome TaxID=412755 RepID=A0A0F9LLB4_9ZZZZ
MKVCSICRQEKPLSEYYRRKTRKNAVQAACKVCCLKRLNAFGKTKKGKICQKNYFKKHQRRYTILQAGLTIKGYNRLFEQQNGCCAICERPQSDFIKHFDIDHNHKTGKIRGLLCHNCNKNLGLYENNQRSFKQNIIEKFERYLK